MSPILGRRQPPVPLPAPGPLAAITHTRRGSVPRYIRRHALVANGDLTRRARKARARIARIIQGAGR